MPTTTPKSAYWQGLRAGLPFIFVAVPFATLFGVVATDAGLTLAQTFGFTALVIAGAAQFAALQMMVDNAPVIMVLLAALAVNLRMAMYSASLAQYLGAAPLWQRALIAYLNFDQTYAVSVTRYEASPKMSVPARVGYFLGVATPIVPIWCGMTLVGAVLGTAIPPSWALDFILPIAFLSMVAPMLKTVPHLVAALVSIIVALLLAGFPSGTGLLIAAAAAMLAGALTEGMFEARQA